jgi:hypothetical protein
MVRAIVDEVAALAQALEIAQPVITRIASARREALLCKGKCRER